MNLRTLLELHFAGTTEGALRGWDTRGRSHVNDEYQHGVHVGIFDRPKSANQHAVASHRYFANHVPSLPERERIFRAFKNSIELPGRHSVSARSLVPMQDTLTLARLERAGRKVERERGTVPEKAPAVFRFQGKDYVIDGHHRLAYEAGKDYNSSVRIFAERHN
jgi:hypothetical protein